MNALTGEPLLDADALRARRSSARDREIANPFTKDVQITAIRDARALPRRPARSASPRRTGSSTRRPAR